MFKDDLKRALGAPLIEVELEDKATGVDDYSFIMDQTLRIIREYLPIEVILRKNVPSSPSGVGEGYLDLSTDGVIQVLNCYIIKRRSGTNDVVLPWSISRIWESVWVGQSDFLGTELLLFQNEVRLISQVTNTIFTWTYLKPEQKLYVQRIPSFATGVGVHALKPATSLDDPALITTSIQYQLALELAVTFAKQRIGMFLSKYKVEGVEMPLGEKYLSEWKEERVEVMKKIEEFAPYPGGLST
jgi:hypothetical protein